ncbi:MAG: DMT family transporter [Cytophagales bacterium]|nr:DMT family transporter [Cytophagales bacterium]MDW8383233.1 DMT family transporter [Flammeovirgaceae bacterium]
MKIHPDYFKLHGLVMLSSLIPTVILFIPIPSFEIVLLRSLMAVIILFFFVFYKKLPINLDKKSIFMMLLAGFLTAMFWTLYFLSSKLANASVALVGFATSPLWVTFIAPLIFKKKVDFYQFMTGLNAVFGIYMIFSTNFDYEWGLALAIIAAAFSGLVTVLNSQFARLFNPMVVNFYQMIGAFLGTLLFLPFYAFFFSKNSSLNFDAGFKGFLLIFLLALIFSVLANYIIISIMKTISPFTISLATNLSPVYGIIFDLLINGRDVLMTIYFYSGAVIIISSVTAMPLVSYFFKDSLPEEPTKPKVAYVTKQVTTK